MSRGWNSSQRLSDEKSSAAWSRSVASTGAILEPRVREALEALAQARWGDPDSGHWRVISNTQNANWVLARYLMSDSEGGYHYARVQVIATVNPAGELVTWQVNNGAEFLGLTDLTAYGLQRGVAYLLDHEYREWISSEPLFAEGAQVRISAAPDLWQRLRDRFRKQRSSDRDT
jgi:hypothetical protein